MGAILRFAAAIGILLVSALVGAQDYPSRPVRIIVPYSPGGLADVAIRVLAQQLSAQLGQPFTVENMPGSNAAAAVNA